MNDDVRAVLAGNRRWAVVQAHVLDGLRQLPDGCVQMACCSPPYWNLRRYECDDVAWGGDQSHAHEWGEEIRVHTGGLQKSGGEMTTEGRTSFEARNEARECGRGSFCSCGAWKGQIGQEPEPQLFVEHLVSVFREVRLVLSDDGVLFVVIGDSWISSPTGNRGTKSSLNGAQSSPAYMETLDHYEEAKLGRPPVPPGLKMKDLTGIPWLTAFALRDDGWWLRDEWIWLKRSCMPYPATDRAVRAHEQVFLLSKQAHYYFGWEAIAEPAKNAGKTISIGRKSLSRGQAAGKGVEPTGGGKDESMDVPELRRARSYFFTSNEPTDEEHYASFPTAVPMRCVLAGSRPGNVVLDPFAGISRTGRAALLSGRRYVGMDMSEKYVEASKRTCEAAVVEYQARVVEVRDEKVRKGLVAKTEARRLEQIGMLFGDGEGTK